jgi:hypothetical protein
MMTVSQLSTFLLEESGAFKGVAPVHFDVCESGSCSREQLGPGEVGDRFGIKNQESITWIDGRMSISF